MGQARLGRGRWRRSGIAAGLERVPGALASSRRGAVAVVFALMLTPLLLMTGLAVDLGRAYIVQTRLSQALDAAALAVSSKRFDDSDERDAFFERFVKANYPATKLGNVVEMTATPVGNRLQVSASATVATVFLRLIGENSILVRASAEVTHAGIEVALVLDNSESMAGPALESLRTAANAMVEQLFGIETLSGSIKIAVVPFAAAVNIGNGPDKAVFVNSATVFEYPDGLDWTNGGNWSGCVEARDESEDVRGDIEDVYDGSDDLVTGRWRPYFWEAESFHNLSGLYFSPGFICRNRWAAPNVQIVGPDPPFIEVDPDLRPTGRLTFVDSGSFFDTTQPWNPMTFQGSYVGGEWVGTDPNFGWAVGPNKGCPKPISPLTEDKDTITDAIADMEAVPAGGTILNLGAVWGWRALSRDLPFDDGSTDNDPDWHKAMLILTDGNMTIGTNPSSCSATNPRYTSQYTAYGYAAEGRVDGITDANDMKNALIQRFLDVCQNIKAKKIEIYTITFNVPVGQEDIKDQMRTCAGDDHYYDAPNAAALTDVFSQIGERLNRLRLSR